MRLIDADKMIAEYCEQQCGCTRQECTLTYEYDGCEACVYVREIEDEPTVDAEPVRHGRWERIMEFNCNPYESEIEEKCSICGRCVQRYGTQPQDNYCPNCGANMKGCEQE